MPYDRDLIRKVQLRTTGATIHAVANLLAKYIGKCDLLGRSPDGKRSKLKGEILQYEGKLRRFILTGTIHE